MCVLTVVRRRRRGANFIVPLVLAIYSLASAAWMLVGIIHALAGSAGIDPSMKATLLAKWISEFMNSTAFWFIVHIPLFIGAYLVDRRFNSGRVAVTITP
jgi:hypothetical protein